MGCWTQTAGEVPHFIDPNAIPQYPSDVIALVVFRRLRYKLGLRDLPEMFLIRGIEFSYEAVRDWEEKLSPALIDNLRPRRRGRTGKSWYVDETYIKVNGPGIIFIGPSTAPVRLLTSG